MIGATFLKALCIQKAFCLRRTLTPCIKFTVLGVPFKRCLKVLPTSRILQKMSSEAEDLSVSTAKKPKFSVLDVDEWQKRWAERKIGFHQDAVHLYLEKYIDKLLNKHEKIDVFMPLCGKAVDIKWLADKGHSVVGVECSSMALEEFFDEQNVEYTTEPVNEVKGSLYKSKDGKIKLYCCDFFAFNKDIAGQFDAIWDRAAMVAINRSDRVKYTDLLKSLMKPECRLALVTLEFDESLHAGPPHDFPEDNVRELYEETCNVEMVESMDGLKERHKGWGLSSLEEKFYVIMKK
ncbi:probable thiopurine S-methyltransferase [Pecten maximus]|uniref:probable thiopurine S-methyltransferase n=1 Tax=Pecten maximus TaxID=6579 RepID=UPI0014585C20|nr:probable thiopurine S-methyltransferase [Pecten maximus]